MYISVSQNLQTILEHVACACRSDRGDRQTVGQTDGGQTNGGQTDGEQTDWGQTDGGQTTFVRLTAAWLFSWGGVQR